MGGGKRRGCDIGEGVRRWRKYGGSTVRQDKQVAPVGSTTWSCFEQVKPWRFKKKMVLGIVLG